MEVQAPDEGHEVGSGLVKPEVLGRSRVAGAGDPTSRIDQQVSELVGEHVEVLASGGAARRARRAAYPVSMKPNPAWAFAQST